MSAIQNIYDSIALCGFSVDTLKLIDDYITDIQNGTENFPRFTLSDHAGFCTTGAPFIGATVIASYARASLEAGSNASGGEEGPNNWEKDSAQDRLIE
ncbi:MAG: hypothetical protein J6Y78_17040 [Paludibacteraceae bacterium]|nr:hypothetical protein [Paludibacteraceae bacterium]